MRLVVSVAQTSCALGQPRPPWRGLSLKSALSTFDKLHAALKPATQFWVSTSSSVGVQGTNPALYRKTETMPSLTAASRMLEERDCAFERASNRNFVSLITLSFSNLKLRVKVTNTPKYLNGSSTGCCGKGRPRYKILTSTWVRCE